MVEDMTMEEEVVEGVAGIMFTDCLRNGWFPFWTSLTFVYKCHAITNPVLTSCSDVDMVAPGKMS